MLNIPSIPEYPVAISNGNTYYVSKDKGMDDIQHGTLTRPFKTIQYGVDQLNAGDKLIVMPAATPYEEQIWIDKSGNSLKYITIKGADGHLIQLTPPPGLKFNYRGFEIRNGSSYLRLLNFEIKNEYLYGVNIRNDCHDIIIENFKISNSRIGIQLTGNRNINISNCEIYNCLTCGIKIYQNSDIKSDNIVIRGTTVHDNKGINIDGFNVGMAATDSGKPADPDDLCHNIYFYNCKAYNNGGEGFDLALAKRAIIINCEAHHNAGQGIKVWGEENWLINSLFYKNGHAGIDIKPLYKMNIYILNCTVADNKIMQIRSERINTMNNIVTELSPALIHSYNNILLYKEPHDYLIYFFDISKNASIIENNNLLFSPRESDIAFIFRKSGTVYKISDIRKENWSNTVNFAGDKIIIEDPNLDENYMPLSNSTVIDCGATLNLTYDRLNRERSNSIDIGAYEFVTEDKVISIPKNIRVKE